MMILLRKGDIELILHAVVEFTRPATLDELMRNSSASARQVRLEHRVMALGQAAVRTQ